MGSIARVSKALRDRTDNYIIGDPYPVPLVFKDGWLRVASRTECRKCGKVVICILRTHRYRSELADYGIVLASKAKDPSYEKIMSSMAVRTEERRTGVKEMHHPGCEVGKVKRTGNMMLNSMTTRGRA